MDDDVKPHKLPEGLVIESKHLSIVSSIIKSRISLGNVILVSIAIVVDDCSNARHAGAHIESIFECRLPVLALVDSVAVSLCKLALRLASEDTH